MKNLVLLGVGCFAAGVISNVMLKKISINFLKLHWSLRYPIRLTILALPYAIMYPKINNNLIVLNDIYVKCCMKLERLKKTGNIQ